MAEGTRKLKVGVEKYCNVYTWCLATNNKQVTVHVVQGNKLCLKQLRSGKQGFV
jgi:hypothetical protein